jgi:SagB-type dehydrogenase family enzyme
VDSASGAGLLHRLTSEDAARGFDTRLDDPRLRQDLRARDPAGRPPLYKDYPGELPTVRLPRSLPQPGVPAAAVLAGRPGPAQPLDAAQLGRVLFLGAGVVRTSQRDWGQHLFRAAGSAGGRFPLEVYASIRGVAGVPDGVHWYHPIEHALVQVGPPAGGEATTLVVTAVPWRTGWQYLERGWRHIYWDAGTLCSQLIAAADSAGWAPRLRSLFPDAAVTELVGADGMHEYPVALLTFGDRPPAVRPAGPAVPGSLPAVELPLCTAAQRAGDADLLGDPWPIGAPLDEAEPAEVQPAGVQPAEVPPSAPLDEVILRRGSQRRMVRGASVPRTMLDFSMRVAMRGIEVPHWVAVHSVDGIEPGLYRWPNLADPVRAGDLRDELARVCMGQELAAEACFVTVAAVRNAELDDRGYRSAQLAAGIVEGRLHLAAYALGVTATGMTFYDSEVPALLAGDADLIPLLFTCVGVGEYASTAGGVPGAPVEVSHIKPRLTDE